MQERVTYVQSYEPETICCANCAHFVQHYFKMPVEGGEKMMRAYCGHCMYPRTKVRRSVESCGNFQKKEEG